MTPNRLRSNGLINHWLPLPHVTKKRAPRWTHRQAPSEPFATSAVAAAKRWTFDPATRVTLDELRDVPIAIVRDGGAFEAGTYDLDDAGLVRQGGPIVIETFGDYVREVAWRRAPAPAR